MFVDDVTDMNELKDLLCEVEDRLLADPDNEQALWDKEDITNRMEEIALAGPDLTNFSLDVATSNAAFKEGGCGNLELARILREVATKLERSEFTPDMPSRISDSNGNRVGSFRWEAR